LDRDPVPADWMEKNLDPDVMKQSLPEELRNTKDEEVSVFKLNVCCTHAQRVSEQNVMTVIPKI